MYKFFKRLIDILVSLSLIILSGIPMIIIAIIIKLEDGRDVFFRQDRTGKNGKIFKLYKFQSMIQDNIKLGANVENQITKFGKFLRKTSLDELPQLFNVLKGDMSLIGPRPWVTAYYDNFTDYQKRRVDVRPGITGLAQVNGRNNLTIFEKIDFDVEYVNKLSLWMDIKVIFLTIKALFSKTGVDLPKAGIYEEIRALNEYYVYSTKPLQVIDIREYKQLDRSIFI